MPGRPTPHTSGEGLKGSKGLKGQFNFAVLWIARYLHGNSPFTDCPGDGRTARGDTVLSAQSRAGFQVVASGTGITATP